MSLFFLAPAVTYVTLSRMKVEQHSIGIPPEVMVKVREYQKKMASKGPELSLSKTALELIKHGLERVRAR
jgi:hypothetical protein